MAKFNAATAVDAMEYDFTAYDGEVGIIPEPSQGQVETYFKNMAEVNKFIAGVQNGASKIDENDTDALEEFVNNLPEDKLQEYKEQIAVWLSDVCSGCISAEYLRDKVPFRVFGAFLRYITGELNPKES